MEFDCLVGRPCGIDVNCELCNLSLYVRLSPHAEMIILQSGNLTIPQAVGHRTIGLVRDLHDPRAGRPLAGPSM